MNPILRFALFGTESTGKTSLAQVLSRHFAEPWAAEFVREYWVQRAGNIGPAHLDAIAQGQLANEEAAAAQARRVVFCDTELLTCTLWNDLLFPGACPAWVRDEANRRAPFYALYLLCDADVAFSPDPQRCFPDPADRAELRQLWRGALVSRGIPFVEIQGDWPRRETTAIAAVEQILARRRSDRV